MVPRSKLTSLSNLMHRIAVFMPWYVKQDTENRYAKSSDPTTIRDSDAIPPLIGSFINVFKHLAPNLLKL